MMKLDIFNVCFHELCMKLMFKKCSSEPFFSTCARASYQLVHSEISPGLLEAITKHANMEYRLVRMFFSLNILVHAVLLDKKPDEVPMLVESVLSKVMEEFENHIASQVELDFCVVFDQELG
uniref:Uncharacterized protein n=1 Tax=Lactuca sativa TaxID=4236 RepID=A0A9R1X449_LACSA|nr:hypothetical protein LSAT_V11C700358350 [Lactuca sativa]